MNNIFDSVQHIVAEQLNERLSSCCEFIPENNKSIDYEIKEALGRQGIVGIVMVPKATYAGKYEDQSLAWQLDEFEVDIVENVQINRNKPLSADYMTALDVGAAVFDILCPLSGEHEGQWCPVTLEEGEDGGLIVVKSVLKCLVYGDRKPDFPPTPPNGKVLYKTSAEGEWLQDDADISYGTFNGFSGKESAVEVIIPSKDSSGNDVTNIGEWVFQFCIDMTSITIPDSVTSIGRAAFLGCSGLTNVTIPDGVSSIGDSAFSGCSGLTSITIPDSVTSIREGAFNSCSGLASVTIPDSVTSIGAGAFFGCSGLTSMTFIGKTTAQVQELENYPWGISDTSIIHGELS